MWVNFLFYEVLKYAGITGGMMNISFAAYQSSISHLLISFTSAESDNLIRHNVSMYAIIKVFFPFHATVHSLNLEIIKNEMMMIKSYCKIFIRDLLSQQWDLKIEFNLIKIGISFISHDKILLFRTSINQIFLVWGKRHKYTQEIERFARLYN